MLVHKLEPLPAIAAEYLATYRRDMDLLLELGECWAATQELRGLLGDRLYLLVIAGGAAALRDCVKRCRQRAALHQLPRVSQQPVGDPVHCQCCLCCRRSSVCVVVQRIRHHGRDGNASDRARIDTAQHGHKRAGCARLSNHATCRFAASSIHRRAVGLTPGDMAGNYLNGMAIDRMHRCVHGKGGGGEESVMVERARVCPGG
mmetsp:Transcript_49261/g.110821  ORF Transcript_49261/g.110821 Transcript_49261/m.110821 type:complete len:203 (-) Transcript_49261:61-669(-)